MVLTGNAKTSLPEHYEGSVLEYSYLAEHNEVRANRIDARFVSNERKEVCTIERAAHGSRVEPRKMRKRHSSMGP